jgi:arylsulfatase A-like enzyme
MNSIPNPARILQGLLAIALICFLPYGIRAAEKPSNIILIISDDQAWTDYGFMDHPHATTPNIDRLAREGLVFPRGYVPSSLCCPSLASIITGRYPHQHKITGNDPPCPPEMARKNFYQSAAFKQGREIMNANLAKHDLLPALLAKQGYNSLQTGKWWQGHFKNGGFTHGMTRGGRHGDAGLEIGRKTMQPISDFIDESRKNDKPFFVWYAPLLPHDPHTPPERLLKKYRDKVPSIHVARYLAMVEWFDESIGQLIQMLEDKGLAENTLIAYVADNGWIQSTDSPKFAPRSKLSPYDGGLRTPIILRQPGVIKPRRDETPVLSLDLFPTLLRAAGATPAKDLPGLDLIDEMAIKNRKEIFGECFHHDLDDLNNPSVNLRWRWMIRGDWKLIVPANTGDKAAPDELYQITKDPLENTNLLGKEQERVVEMKAALDAWWKP